MPPSIRYRGVIHAPAAALEVFMDHKALARTLADWFTQQAKGERVITKIEISFQNGPVAEFTLTEDVGWQEKVVQLFEKEKDNGPA